MVMLTQVFNGSFHPNSCNPYKNESRPMPKKGETDPKESERGWKLLGKGLSMIAQGGKKKGAKIHRISKEELDARSRR